ncbi:unnamed protein product [Urochloa humidicola]
MRLKNTPCVSVDHIVEIIRTVEWQLVRVEVLVLLSTAASDPQAGVPLVVLTPEPALALARRQVLNPLPRLGGLHARGWPPSSSPAPSTCWRRPLHGVPDIRPLGRHILLVQAGAEPPTPSPTSQPARRRAVEAGACCAQQASRS